MAKYGQFPYTQKSTSRHASQDEEYSAAGAKLVGAKEAFGSDIVLKVRPPKIGDETSLFKSGAG